MKLTIGIKYINWLTNNGVSADWEVGKKIDELIKKHQYNNAYNYFKTKAQIHNIEIPDDIKLFFQTMKKIKNTEEFITEAEEVNDDILEFMKLYAEGVEGDKIFLTYEEGLSNAQIRNIITYVFNETGKLLYLITPHDSLNGRIVSYSDNFEKIEVCRSLVKSKNDVDIYSTWVFGEPLRNYKGHKVVNTLVMPFHEYVFNANGIRYILYSRKKLKLGRCVVRGQIVPIIDQRRIGEEARTSKVLEVMFLYDVNYNLHKITREKAEQIRKGWTSDKIGEALFGKRRHPQWFEKLIFSIIANRRGFALPSHLLVIGKPSTGKTTGILKSLQYAFNEYQGVISGNGSTLKALIPAYKEVPPTAGFLSEAERVALVDEFFQFVAKAQQYEKVIKGGDYFAELKDILEGNEKIGRSGNSSSAIKYKMLASMIAVTNPQEAYQLSTVYDFAQKFDPAFCSRMILYQMNEEHENFIRNNQPKITFEEGEDKAYPEFNPDFVNLMDWFNEDVFIKVDAKKVSEMIERLKKFTPVDLIPIMIRYNNTIANVLAGVSKYRWLANEKNSFELDDEDYKQTEEIFSILIASWCRTDEELLKVPEKHRIGLIDLKARKVLNYLNDNYKVKDYESVKEYIDISKLDFNLSLSYLYKLRLVKKVKIDGEMYYVPYWYSQGEEIKIDIIDEVVL